MVAARRGAGDDVAVVLSAMGDATDDLMALAEKIGGVTLKHIHDMDAPKGVGGRNSDNTFIQQVLGWAPSTPLEEGLRTTYAWIEQQYNDRKAGKRTVEDVV